MKVAIIKMNEALNSSEAGKKSKNLLEAKGAKMQAQLKTKEDKLMQLKKDLDNNLVNAETRRKKAMEFENLQKDYMEERQKLEMDLKGDEQKYTETIFKDLKTVVEQVAKNKNYDLVIEYSVSTAILFSKLKMDDITDEVLSLYNSAKK